MSWISTKGGYGRLAIFLHWLMLALIVAAYATMEFKSIYPKGSASREALAAWHYAFGLSVFFLVWLRLLVRVLGQTPVIEPALPLWQDQLAEVMHWALYAFMAFVPLLGWITVSAQGKPIFFLGYQLPALINESERLAKWLKELHESGATAGYFLIGLHAAAALYHRYVKRDNTMRLMWH